jgi:hypothetical protein
MALPVPLSRAERFGPVWLFGVSPLRFMPIIETLLVLCAIAALVTVLAATRQYWQFSFLRFCHSILRFWQTLLFSSLCLLVPAAFRRFVALSWEEYYESLPFRTVTLTWLILGALTACLVLGWSAWGFRHHKVRGIIGMVICAVTFWGVYASVQAFPEMKRHFEQQVCFEH